MSKHDEIPLSTRLVTDTDDDGVPLGTQYPVGFGQTFQYLFRAQPAGTHFYHCHNMTPLHVQVGMYGPLIIESAGKDPIKSAFPYERDYTLVLSEIDTNMVRDQLNDMQRMGLSAPNGRPRCAFRWYHEARWSYALPLTRVR